VNRGQLISFSGVDSAGKSTQIEALRTDLLRQGVVVKVLWYRPGYSPMLDRLRAVVRRVRPGALPPRGPTAERQAAFSRPFVQRTWVRVALIDTLLRLALVRWWLARGAIVICDRYVDDWCLDLQLNFPLVDTHCSGLSRLMQRLAPPPKTSLLLLLGWDEMTRRAATKSEPFPDSPEIRRKRFDAYQALADNGTFQTIEADRSPEQVHQDIVTTLGAGPWSLLG
jgi:thymidylate kinase